MTWLPGHYTPHRPVMAAIFISREGVLVTFASWRHCSACIPCGVWQWHKQHNADRLLRLCERNWPSLCACFRWRTGNGVIARHAPLSTAQAPRPGIWDQRSCPVAFSSSSSSRFLQVDVFDELTASFRYLNVIECNVPWVFVSDHTNERQLETYNRIITSGKCVH